MDAVDYLRLKRIMTNDCEISCYKCPLSVYEKKASSCRLFQEKYPDEAVAIVKDWFERGRLKTRAEVFFELCPGAIRNSNGNPMVCAKDCGLADKCKFTLSCDKCWNEFADGKYQKLGE